MELDELVVKIINHIDETKKETIQEVNVLVNETKKGVIQEVNILLEWRYPLTPIAMRYTSDRSINFDIYLPKMIAKYNM